MHLIDFDIAAFLRDHWQRKPLLIRSPWDHWRNPLEPGELAGLACEEGVESRLVVSRGEDWRVESGPIPEARFGELGKQAWTLLVQAVDHRVPEVAALIAPFRFIPNWRIDDVMVSYATDQGGVGPHFDQYDVFLIQGLGRRRWRVGARCGADTELRPHDDLRLLAKFEALDEWILEPGDILYVPPGFAHDGVALGDDCMTYSVGFRAPARSELIAHWCDHVLADLPEDDRYSDPGMKTQGNPGEIAPEALDRLLAMIAKAMLDRDAFARWFGQYATTPKYPEIDWAPEEPIGIDTVRALLTFGAVLYRNPASRFAFIRQDANQLLLFVDGERFSCTEETAAFAERLCAADSLEIDLKTAGSAASVALIAALVDQGSVTFEGPDED